MNRLILFVLLALLSSLIVVSAGCVVEESKLDGLAKPQGNAVISTTAVGCVLTV